MISDIRRNLLAGIGILLICRCAPSEKVYLFMAENMSLEMPNESYQAGEMVLSERERHYLGLVARGKHPRQVAATTGANEADVRDTLEQLCRKLGASNLLNAVSIALLRGLIEQEA